MIIVYQTINNMQILHAQCFWVMHVFQFYYIIDWLVGWLVVVSTSHSAIFQLFSDGTVVQLFQMLTCCRVPNAMGSYRSLACRAYPDIGTWMSEDVFNLLAIRGPICGEAMPGIDPGSSDPQSSPLPLRHRGGLHNSK